MARRFEPVLKTLNDADVRYLVVGGVAVVLHGHLRATADLDLVIQLEADNVRRGLVALARAGFRPRAPVQLESFADAEVRRSWIETKGLQVFSLWHEDLRGFEVDLFVTEPFDFDEVWRRRQDVRLGSTSAPVVALEDLLRLKQRAGRAQDLADIEALEALPSGGSGHD